MADFFKLLISLLLLVANAWASGPTIRFADLPRLLQQGNKQIQGGLSLVKASELRTDSLARSFLPRVEATLGEETFHGTGKAKTQPYGEVGAKVNLYRGGRDRLEENIRQDQVRLNQSLGNLSYREVLSEARKNFWSLLSRQEVTRLLGEALALNEKNKVLAQRRIDGGLATQTDRLEFEMNQRLLNQELLRVKMETSTLSNRLGAILNIEGDFALDPSTEERKLPSSVLPQHPLLQKLDSQIGIMRDQKQKLQFTNRPSLDIYTSYTLYTYRDRERENLRDRDEAVLGIKLTMPLFDGKESLAERGAIEQELRGLSLQAEQSRRELSSHYESALASLPYLLKLIEDAERISDQGKSYLTRTMEEYGRGLKNSPDVLSATSRYVESRKRILELKLDYQNVRVDLLSLSEE